LGLDGAVAEGDRGLDIIVAVVVDGVVGQLSVDLLMMMMMMTKKMLMTGSVVVAVVVVELADADCGDGVV
jgi:hypothetical protein